MPLFSVQQRFAHFCRKYEDSLPQVKRVLDGTDKDFCRLALGTAVNLASFFFSLKVGNVIEPVGISFRNFKSEAKRCPEYIPEDEFDKSKSWLAFQYGTSVGSDLRYVTKDIKVPLILINEVYKYNCPILLSQVLHEILPNSERSNIWSIATTKNACKHPSARILWMLWHL